MVTVTESQSLSSARKRSPARTAGRRIALGLGIVLLLLSLLASYAQAVIISDAGFADHATAALDNAGVRSALSSVLVGRLLANSPKLQVAEPILQEAVGAVIASSAFKQIFRSSLTQTHRALLSEHNSRVILNLSGEGALILGLVSVRDPKLAQNPRIASARDRLSTISQGNALLPVIQALNRVRAIALLAPLGALLCFFLSIALAVNRRRGLHNVGLAIAIPAFIVWLLLALGQWASPSFVDQPLSQALPGIWQAFLGDLRRWSLTLVLAGLVVMAIADAARQPPSPQTWGRMLRSWTDPAAAGSWRLVLAGAVVVALGCLLVFNPIALVRLLLVAAGVVLTYWGVFALLSLVAPGAPATSLQGAGTSEGTIGAGRWSALAVILVAVALLWVRNVWMV